MVFTLCSYNMRKDTTYGLVVSHDQITGDCMCCSPSVVSLISNDKRKRLIHVQVRSQNDGSLSIIPFLKLKTTYALLIIFSLATSLAQTF